MLLIACSQPSYNGLVRGLLVFVFTVSPFRDQGCNKHHALPMMAVCAPVLCTDWQLVPMQAIPFAHSHMLCSWCRFAWPSPFHKGCTRPIPFAALYCSAITIYLPPSPSQFDGIVPPAHIASFSTRCQTICERYTPLLCKSAAQTTRCQRSFPLLLRGPPPPQALLAL